MMMGFLSSSTLADEKLDKKQDRIDTIKASAIIPLKLELLEWKLKYYQEKTISIQLRAMIQVWNQVEFQKTQKIIRETDQAIKHLLLAK